jgi:hypothetical protein
VRKNAIENRCRNIGVGGQITFHHRDRARQDGAVAFQDAVNVLSGR